MIKTIGTILAVLVVMILLGIILYKTAIRPWMMTWGATEVETRASLPGDELLPSPAVIQTNGITIHAAPEKIWPWLVQIGQDRGGFYSIDWLENLAGCDIHSANQIVAEWQDVKPGDLVPMYPKEKNGPPPYIVAYALPNKALILGHHPGATLTGDAWNDTWQFVLQPVDAATTRLVIRSRTNNAGGIWNIVEPMSFIMQRSMMFGLRDRSEKTA